MDNKINNRMHKFFALFFILFFLTQVIFAQNNVDVAATQTAENETEQDTVIMGTGGGGYYVRKNENGEDEIVQKLAWEALYAALEYEIVIEKKNTNKNNALVYEEVHREKTENAFLEVVLHDGYYRYNVSVYNLLGQLETTSDWEEFEIIKAYKPEITSVSPTMIYLDEEFNGIFSVNGRNLVDGGLFYLRRVDSEGKGYQTTVNDRKDNQRSVDLKVNLRYVIPGEYNIFSINPGGLSHTQGPITVKFKKAIDIDFSVGYALPVLLYDEEAKRNFTNIIWPISFATRVSVLPFKSLFAYLGVGVSAVYSKVAIKTEFYSLDGNAIFSHVNFVYQFPAIKNKFVIEAHVGVGATAITGLSTFYTNKAESDRLNSLYFSLNGGIAFQIYLYKRLYLDICTDFIHSFVENMPLGTIVPSISIGYQF